MRKFKRELEDIDLDINDLLYDDSIEDKILSPEEERKIRLRHRMTAVALILVVGVILSSILLGNNSSAKKDNTTKQAGETEQAEQEQTQTPEDDFDFDTENYPEITELVQLYYKARLTGDMSSIEKYVDNIEDVNMSDIKANNQFIKKYNNIECYLKPGLDQDTYVVYVYYEIKFKNIETLAPGIDVLYVIRDSDTGSVFIHNGANANADIKSYIDALTQDEEVSALYERANNALNEAIQADQALSDFYNALKEGAHNEE